MHRRAVSQLGSRLRRRQDYSTSDSTWSAGKQTEQTGTGPETGKQRDTEAEDPKEIVLQKAIHFIPTHGWSKDALAAGASEAGFPSVSHGMFPNGSFDLIDYVMRQANLKVSDRLEQLRDSGELHEKPTNLRIREGIKARIEYLSQFQNSWPQAMAQGLYPEHIPTTATRLAHVADEIWYQAGDQSTDINWYTRRGLLTAVIIASELHMLSDTSANLEDTWAFIDRRLDDVSNLGYSAGSFSAVLNSGFLATTSIAETVFDLAGPLLRGATGNVGSLVSSFTGLISQVMSQPKADESAGSAEDLDRNFAEDLFSDSPKAESKSAFDPTATSTSSSTSDISGSEASSSSSSPRT